MNYGKITKQELSQELIDLLEKMPEEITEQELSQELISKIETAYNREPNVVFMTENNVIPIEERKENTLYILELSENEDPEKKMIKANYQELKSKLKDLESMIEAE